MSGEKKFINNSGAKLTVILSVRKGGDPNQKLKDASFSIEVGESKRFKYGDSQNPFLTAMQINSIRPGFGGIATTRVVIQRGDVIDNQFNMNDTVVFGWDGSNVLFSFKNTWTR